jgi:hypothetical protein
VSEARGVAAQEGDMKSSRFALSICICLAALVLSGCSSAILGYLVYDYLNDSAPKIWWSGKVTDSQGEPVAGVRVQVRAEVLGKDDVLAFSETTDKDGDFKLKFRWANEVSYSVRVYDENDQTVYDHFVGKVAKAEQKTDIVLEGSYHAEISGVVRDAEGKTLQNVVILVASANTLEADPAFLRDSEDALVYDETNEGGIYSITGRLLDYAIVCAYHPDYGFAYAYAEDTDSDGSIGLNIVMGTAGQHDVDVKVVNGLGLPIVSQVLATAQQFRVKMSQRWDFSEEMDAVVHDHNLFPGRGITPSDQQPETVVFAVQATDVNGIAQGVNDIAGASYDLSLLRIGDDQLATALVTSANPLALAEDSVITVRIN